MAALPTKLTCSAPYSVRCRSTSSASATHTSRAAIAPNSHHGMIPRTPSAMTVAAMYSRSAAGSSSCPSLLVWLSIRASLPSSQSLIPAKPSSAAAMTSAVAVRGPRTSHRNTGTPASRAALSAFGQVTIRSPTL